MSLLFLELGEYLPRYPATLLYSFICAVLQDLGSPQTYWTHPDFRKVLSSILAFILESYKICSQVSCLRAYCAAVGAGNATINLAIHLEISSNLANFHHRISIKAMHTAIGNLASEQMNSCVGAKYC